MRVDVVGLRTTLHWSFHLDEEDGKYTDVISMIENKFTTQLPKGITIDDVHPDHLALVALLVCHPFTHKKISIPWGVSERFAESCSKISKYQVEFEHTNVQASTMLLTEDQHWPSLGAQIPRRASWSCPRTRYPCSWTDH